MPYTGELQRNSPFSFQTPAIFSPWVDRLLVDLRRRLKDKGHNAASVRKVAKLLEGHLNAVSMSVLERPEIRTALEGACTTGDAKAFFLSADTPAKIRASMSDFDLLFSRQFTGTHLVDVPPGFYEVDPFDKSAVLALWKFASAKEAFELGGATPLAISLAMEGLTCANLAVAFDDGDRELAREMHHLSQTTTQAVGETIAAKKQESKAIRAPAAKKANETLWGPYKQRAYELACSKPFRSYAAAADFIQPILENEPGLYRHANHRKIGEWIKAMGWRPGAATTSAASPFAKYTSELSSLSI